MNETTRWLASLSEAERWHVLVLISETEPGAVERALVHQHGPVRLRPLVRGEVIESWYHSQGAPGAYQAGDQHVPPADGERTSPCGTPGAPGTRGGTR